MLLAVAAVALGTVALYLGILRVMDPHLHDKGGMRSLRASVLAGAVSAICALPVELILWVFEDGAIELSSRLLVSVLFTGQVEELAKFVAFLVIMRRGRAFKEPLDAATHAAAVGLGFSVLESLSYGLTDGLGVQMARAFSATPGHMVYCALWGVYYAGVRTGQWKGKLWRSPLSLFLVLIPSASIHGLFNHLLDSGLSWVAFALDAAGLAAALTLVRMLGRTSAYRLRPELLPPAEIRGSLPLLRTALAYHPSSFLLNRTLAESHLRLGSYPSAVAALDASLVTAPRDAETLALKACVLMVQGRVAEGTPLLESAARAVGYAGRRRLERRLLRVLGMRTPASTPRASLAVRYLMVSTLRELDLVPRAAVVRSPTAPR